MDKSGEIQKEQENVSGVAPSASQMAYCHNQNDPLVASGTPFVAVPTPTQPPAAFSNSIDQLVASGTPSVAVPSPTQPPVVFSNSIDQLVASDTPYVAVPTPTQPPVAFSNSIDQLAYLQAQHFHHQQQQQQHFGHQQQQQIFGHQLQQQQYFGHQLQQQQYFDHQLQQQQQDFHLPLQQQLKVLWEKQMQEIVQTNCFSKHSFPPTRIKRIMKKDEDVQMVSADAPVLFAKAIEMFTLDLSLRSWFHAKENRRSKLQKNDVAAAIKSNVAFGFLVDIIPKDELKEEEGPGIAQLTIPMEEGLGTGQSTIPISEGRGIAQSTIPISEGLGIAQSTIPIEKELGFAQSNIPITYPANQMQEIDQTDCLSKHSFPLNRIKKIMKMDEDVQQVSADAPVLFAKACEMFIFDLTQRSWIHGKENKRSTLQKKDVAAAIVSNVAFGFLVDIIQKDELKEEEGPGIPQFTIPIEEGLGTGQSTILTEEEIEFAQSTILITGSATDLPYYDVSLQHPVGSTGMITGNPVDQAALYSTLQRRPPNPNPQPPQQQSTTLYSTQLPRPPV